MEQDQAASSAVEFAAQTGRLDLVSVLLAVVALLLAIGAFPAFWFVKSRAEQIAKDEVQEILKGITERLEAEAIRQVEEMLPGLIRDYGEFARQAAGQDVADAIAAAQEGSEVNDDNHQHDQTGAEERPG